MCLSTVYKTTDPDTVLMEYVSKISVEGDRIICTDVMGDERVIPGTLAMIDLTGGVVKIDCSEQ